MHRTTYGLLAIGIGILLGSSSLAILVDTLFSIQPIGPYAQLVYEKISIPILAFLAGGMIIVYGFSELRKGETHGQDSGDGNGSEGREDETTKSD